MKDFFGYTTWSAIILIAFGLITGVFPNAFASWFFFAFFCVIGFLGYATTFRK